MHPSEARKIITDNNLIPQKISKKIINYINGKKNILEIEIFNYVKKKEIIKLRKKFIRIKKKLKKCEPRNLPIYLIIREKNKNFDWEKINEHFDINFNTDDLGLRVSLSSILFNRTRSNKSFIEKKYNYKFKKNMPTKVQNQIKKLFDEANIIYPDSLNFDLFIKFFEKALKEKKANIVSPICPDYSVKYVAPDIYQFTFEKVNSNIGVIGQKILKNLNTIHDFFIKYKIKVNHIIAIGDFECLSPKILDKVQCSKKQFINKLKKSQMKFKNSTKLKVKTPLFSDLCSGLKNWEKINNKNFIKLKKNKFGKSRLNPQKILEIADSRKELYKRWFNDFKINEIKDIIYRQGSEYASMGEIIKKKFKNPLVIGADHHKMSEFYKVTSKFPIIYVKNQY